MRTAIIGTGGIGGPLGASLAAAGQDVVFVARGAHLAAMKGQGLRIEGDRGLTEINPVQATDDMASIGTVDLILSCVKLWDLETSAKAMRPLLGADTVIVPLQNGVDASERLIAVLGAGPVMGGVAMVTGSIVAPGVIRQTGKHHGIIFGELDGRMTARAERIRDVCKGAGIDAVLTDDIQLARWDKFTGLVAGAGVCAVTRQPLGVVRDDPDIAPLFWDAMQEVMAVGRACGVRFGPEVEEKWSAFLKGAPPHLTPSMAVDLRAGNRLELKWLTGKAVELGRAHGVPTPVNAVIYGALKPYADGTLG